MINQFKTSWYNSPRLMLGLFILGIFEPYMLIPALIIFLLHYKHYQTMMAFIKNVQKREDEIKAKEFAAEDIIRNAKLEASNLISRANNQKVALEIEIIELKQEISALTSDIIEKNNEKT